MRCALVPALRILRVELVEEKEGHGERNEEGMVQQIGDRGWRRRAKEGKGGLRKRQSSLGGQRGSRMC